MNIDLMSKKRRHRLGHPWTRGYRNNKWIRAAVELTEEPPQVRQFVMRTQLKAKP